MQQAILIKTEKNILKLIAIFICCWGYFEKGDFFWFLLIAANILPIYSDFREKYL